MLRKKSHRPPVAKKVAKGIVKASATEESVSKKKLPKKNLLRETIKSVMKPSAAEEGEKLCEEPLEDKGQGDPATLS